MAKKLIYNIGINAGFFSEVNSMLIARLYCYDKGIDFSLYSKKSNFRFDKGWEDYFEPFCETATAEINRYINFDRYKTKPKTAKQQLLKAWKSSYKLTHPNVLLTEDIWIKIRSLDFVSKKFNLPVLHADKGDIFFMLRIILKQIWVYNTFVKNYLKTEMSRLLPPGDFCSIHIRRGDKVKESVFQPLSDYVEALPQLTEVHHIYVATDDYTVVEELRSLYPTINFFTNCPLDNRGYQQWTFNNLSSDKIKTDILNLLLDVEMIKASKHFSGTMSSNVGLFLALYKNIEECSYIDTFNRCFIN